MKPVPHEELLQQLGRLAREEAAHPAAALHLDTDAKRCRNEHIVQAVLTQRRQEAAQRSWFVDLKTHLRSWFSLSLMACAAALLGWVAWPAPRLPGYELDIVRHVAVMRGAETARRESLPAGEQAQILLRPATNTATDPQVEVTFDDGHTQRAIDPATEYAASGAVRLSILVPNQPGKLQISLRPKVAFPRSLLPRATAPSAVWHIDVAASR